MLNLKLRRDVNLDFNEVLRALCTDHVEYEMWVIETLAIRVKGEFG